MTYDWLVNANATRWTNCHVKPDREKEVMEVAARLVEAKAKFRYQAVEAATGVPWFVIAVIHEREASQKWNTQLGQGDPLNQVSKHVPRGRGPFYVHPTDGPGHDAWHRAAVDALTNCPPFTARWKDWSSGGTITAVILYNGVGYEMYHHEASPYAWGATDQEMEGKYTGDGKYNAEVWDTQLGCAAMFLGMMKLDPTIKFGTPNAPVAVPAASVASSSLIGGPSTVVHPPPNLEAP